MRRFFVLIGIVVIFEGRRARIVAQIGIPMNTRLLTHPSAAGVNAQHRLEYPKNGIIFLRIGDFMPKSRKLFKL